MNQLHHQNNAPSSSTTSTRDKISLIAAKLITGVQPISPQQAHDRWTTQQHPSHRHTPTPTPNSPHHHPQPADPPRSSITASVFAAARLERAAQRQALQPNNQPQSQRQQPPLPRGTINPPPHQRPLSTILNHQPTSTSSVSSSSTPPLIYHHRSHTQLDIFSPPKPPFAQQAISPLARAAKSSAPAVMDAGDDHPALLQSIQNAAALQPHLSENLPPRDPRPNLLSYQDPHKPPSSPSKASRSFLPLNSSSPRSNPPQPPHAIRDVYLSQVGDHNGKVENEKQRVDREFEKLLDTMQITPAVRTKMTGLDHPVKSAMLKSSTSTSLMNLMNPQEVHHHPPHHHRVESVATMEDQKQEGSAWWAIYLKSHNFRELLASDLKKLRVALRTKKPSWTQEFVGFGGYTALLKRLKELLEIEWREEQHDDQVLYEILRCCKALLLTEPGRRALGSRLPDPFIQLTGLLYSEKKPGDLATRQVIVELIQGCFELEEYISDRPFLDSHALNWSALISLSEAPPQPSMSPPAPAPEQHHRGLHLPHTPDALVSKAHALVFQLLAGPPDPKMTQIVEFVAASRRVRRFKTFVNEVIGVLMDYFWIFCHNENPFWDLKAIDEEGIEAPKVPSGMTGGVEYEAMSYCTYLMKLINQLIKTSGSQDASRSICQDLFISGFERCLTLRKSSMNYYPMVHLELARFIHLGLLNHFEFPYSILKHVSGHDARPL